ncbi:MAG: 30S ribosomal protein S1 [Spirochaetes bacterium]|nr:MAG: 30S ribosomal protein S1 [Spirochaetota bacterium]
MENENFEKLLEDSFSGVSRLKPGQEIEAEIVSITDNCIFLQLNGKSEGQLDVEEFMDRDGNITVSEGDKIKAYFLNSKNGEIHFTTRISGEKAGDALLQSAFEGEIPVEGTVEKEIKGGFEVKIGESRAFCPYSQMGMKRVENAQEYIGKHLTFKILEYKEKGRNILVSNRAILEKERREKVEALKKTLKEGMTVTGVVKSLRDFGAFIDLDGVQALLPVSEISRSRVKDIEEVLSIGQKIEAVILKLDWAAERISVSMKKLLADPWDSAEGKYKEGSQHTGEVVRLTNFGAFVSLEPGLDGLIHISDLEKDSRDYPERKQKKLKVGERITVEINSVDAVKKRISLKPADDTQGKENFSDYMDSDSDSEGYNPFAALLKDKK